MPLIRDTALRLASQQRKLSLAAGNLQLVALHRLFRRAASVQLRHAAGVAYVARDTADTTRLPLVGVHGFGGDKETWLLFGTLLPRTQPMYFLDLPGHGESAAAPAATIAAHAAAVIAMMDDAGVRRAVVCGNSMGGGVALRLAVSYPQRVAGLVLIDSVGNDIHANPSAQAWVHGDNPLIPAEEDIDEFVDIMLKRRLPVPRAVVRAVVLQRARRADTLRRLYHDFIMFDGDQGVPADISALAVPTLIIHGEQDEVISVEVARQLAKTIAGAELTVLRGVGHAPQLEAPRATAHAVASFMLRCERGNR